MWHCVQLKKWYKNSRLVKRGDGRSSQILKMDIIGSEIFVELDDDTIAVFDLKTNRHKKLLIESLKSHFMSLPTLVIY